MYTVILLCGDLNGRTSNEFPVGQSDDDGYIYPVDETLRCSEDSVLNQYGKMLLNLCIAFGLNIMNGVCNGDLQGRFAFIYDSGTAIILLYLKAFLLFFNTAVSFVSQEESSGTI